MDGVANIFILLYNNVVASCKQKALLRLLVRKLFDETTENHHNIIKSENILHISWEISRRVLYPYSGLFLSKKLKALYHINHRAKSARMIIFIKSAHFPAQKNLLLLIECFSLTLDFYFTGFL